MAHTPGPWTLNDSGTSIVVSGGPNNDDIADFSYCDEHTVSITRDEALANARLFVAAPRMLAVVEEMAEIIEWSERRARPHWDGRASENSPLGKARAAIAKARGAA